jgi:class 3 adenylate cyclase/tetratricopeptide (TPR) repeat protein
MTGEPHSSTAGLRPDPDEIRPVTSLFADVVGSTGLGERLTAAEVKALIGECVTRMCEAIEGFGGSVRSYMGDGIAGFFGIDVARQDDCERAVRAALEIRHVVAEYARDVRAAWGVNDFNVRVGINSGRVAVGQIGASDPQRLALGDSINVAARLQGAARPGSILIGPAVADSISHRFVLHPIGAVEIRGRAAVVHAYELEAEGAGHLRRLTEGPFVGRRDELGALASSLVDLGKGRGQVALVTGEAGLGKSRLVREARKRAPSEVLWLDGYCDAVDARLPYRPFVDALCAWLGVSRQASPIEIRVRLSAVGRELFEDRFDEVVPFLARLLGVSMTTRLDRRMDGLPHADLEAALVRSLGEWLSVLAMRRPVVLAIDNFCSAAEPTVRAAESLLARIESVPFLLMVTARSEAYGPWEELRARALTDFRSRCVEVHVEPLRTEDGHELVGALASEGWLLPRLAELIVDRAEGNPLYIEELLAAVSGSPDPGLEFQSRIPSALEGVLLARIDALPIPTRRVLQAAAVLGRTFMHDVLVGMVDDPAGEAEIARLVRADVIREHGREPKGYAFRHGLIRDAALSTLTPRHMQLLNARAADALQAWRLFDPDRDACALVGYYVDSDRDSEAIDCLDRLANQLVLVCRWDDAVSLLERCLDRVKERGEPEVYVQVTSKLARILEEQGRLDDAIAYLDVAIAMEQDSQPAWQLRVAKARCLAELGWSDDADQLLETCISNAPDALTAADARIARGLFALNRDDLATATECVTDLQADLGGLPPEVAFQAFSLMSGVKAMGGSLEEAERWALQAQELASQLGQVSLQFTARHQAALVSMLRGRYADANAQMQSVYDESTALGLGTARMQTVVSLMHLKLQCGELDEAARIGQDALERASSPAWVGFIAANLAEIRCEQGQYSTADELAQIALTQGPISPHWVRAGAKLVRSAVAREAGDFAREESELATAFEAAIAEEAHRVVVAICLHSAERCIRRGSHHQAREWLDRAMDYVGDADCVATVNLRRLTGMMMAREDVARAIDDLMDVREDAGRMALKLEEGRVLVALAQIDSGNRDAHLLEAERLFETCGSVRGAGEVARVRSGTFVSAPV